MTGKRSINLGEVEVGVMHFDRRKRPCLYVYFKDENCAYKVASFNSEETADWFIEVIEEAIRGNQ